MRINKYGVTDAVKIGLAVAAILVSTGPAQATPSYADEGIWFNHHRVVLDSVLPSCAQEDQESGAPCTWNVNEGDGNGLGLSFWVHEGKVTYVWTENPVILSEGKWSWVPGSMRVRLRDEGLDLDTSCMWRHTGDDYSTIRCANGARYSVNW